MTIWALTENQTACAETALCGDCIRHRPHPKDPNVRYDSDKPVDCTGNTDLACQWCGYQVKGARG